MKNKDEIEKPIALFDLDSTLVDYEGGLLSDLESLRSPDEPKITTLFRDKEEQWLKNRIDIIRKDADWWKNLRPFKTGMIVHNLAKSLGFRIFICTQGPRTNADAWKGKVQWVRDNLPPDTDIVVTRDKGIIYGKVLVDDFPEYVEKWLNHRPRGFVIMPAHPYNEGYTHPNVIRYDGNIETYNLIEQRLKEIKDKFDQEQERE